MIHSESLTAVARHLFAAAALLAVVACGSSAPVRYYSLEALEQNHNEVVGEYIAVGIGPLRAPDYLSRANIVTRGPGAEMLVDDFSRWVEPVDDATHRIVAANVDSLLGGGVAIAFPYSHNADLDYQVIGRIDRFEADQQGEVSLSIQWAMIGRDSELVVEPRRRRYESQATSAHDHASIAAAMSEVLLIFSRAIAAELEQIRGQ